MTTLATVRTPSTWQGRLLAHAWEAAFAGWFTLIGVFLMLTGFEMTISSLQEALPAPLVAAWAFALGIGGPLIITGLVWSSSGTTGRGLERAGLNLVGSAWTTYAITIIAVTSQVGIISVGQSVMIVIACILRLIELRKVENAVAKISVTLRPEE